MLSRAQFGLDRALWAGVLAVRPGVDRHAMHAELGLPESRKEWTNRHFDEWKRACLAIAQPGNLDAQMEGLGGEVKRRVFVIQKLLGELGEPVGYAETILRRMGMEPPLERLTAAQLEKVIVALRKQGRRTAHRAVATGADADDGNDPF